VTLVFVECSIKIIDKETVTNVQFVEFSLPSVTLDKDFDECFPGFAECLF
jgi:hypothetical protein